MKIPEITKGQANLVSVVILAVGVGAVVIIFKHSTVKSQDELRLQFARIGMRTQEDL